MDRDPELFSIVLQCLRNYSRPPQALLESRKQCLLQECKFFGAGWLAERISGSGISMLDAKLADRQLALDEQNGGVQLLDPFVDSIGVAPREDLELPLLLTDAGNPFQLDCMSVEELARRLEDRAAQAGGKN